MMNPLPRTRLRPLLAALAGLSLMAASCSSDSTASSDAGSASTATTISSSEVSTAATAAAEGVESSSSTETVETTKVNVSSGASSIAVITAIEKGFFAEEGLEVELVTMSGPAGITAATEGSVDIAYSDILAWASALGNGFENVRLVYPANGAGSEDLLVKADSGITSLADLAGKRIIVPAAPIWTVSIKAWAVELGLDPDDFEFIQGQGQGNGPALDNGDVAAAYTLDPETTKIIHDIGATSLGDPVAEALPTNATLAAYFGNADFIDEHPDAVDAFVRAVIRGGEYFQAASFEEKAEIQGKYSGLDWQQLQKDIPGALEGYRYPDLQLTPLDVEAQQAWVDTAFELGGIPAAVDIAPFLHTTAIDGPA